MTGVSGLVRRYPKEDLNVVLLSNMDNGTWEPARKIHEMMVAGLWQQITELRCKESRKCSRLFISLPKGDLP